MNRMAKHLAVLLCLPVLLLAGCAPDQPDAAQEGRGQWFVLQQQTETDVTRTVRYSVYRDGTVDILTGSRGYNGHGDYDFKVRLEETLRDSVISKSFLDANEMILAEECLARIRETYLDMPWKDGYDPFALFAVPNVFSTLLYGGKTYYSQDTRNRKAMEQDLLVRLERMLEKKLMQGYSLWPPPAPGVRTPLFHAEGQESIMVSQDGVGTLEREEMTVAMDGEHTAKFVLDVGDRHVGPGVYVSGWTAGQGSFSLDGLLRRRHWPTTGEDAGFRHQLSCHDFDKDGTKEVVIASGNDQDMLFLCVLRLDFDKKAGTARNPAVETAIKGGLRAYADPKGRIWVVDKGGRHTMYLYDELSGSETDDAWNPPGWGTVPLEEASWRDVDEKG